MPLKTREPTEKHSKGEKLDLFVCFSQTSSKSKQAFSRAGVGKLLRTVPERGHSLFQLKDVEDKREKCFAIPQAAS